jgi:hypothetical protein
MVTPNGRWRVEEIRVERGGRTLTRLRVSTFGGVFVAEVADVDRLVALGVPLDQLVIGEYKTPEELGQVVDLAELVEDDEPGRAGPTSG